MNFKINKDEYADPIPYPDKKKFAFSEESKTNFDLKEKDSDVLI